MTTCVILHITILSMLEQLCETFSTTVFILRFPSDSALDNGLFLMLCRLSGLGQLFFSSTLLSLKNMNNCFCFITLVSRLFGQWLIKKEYFFKFL